MSRVPALIAIDTSIGTSVAVGVGGEVFEFESADQRGHTEAIGELIAAGLDAPGVSPARIMGVVVGIGPGPFTGLRVGIAAAKALAAGLGVPLLPLSGHEAVAFEAMSRTPDERPVRVLQDARRRELFVTEYTGLDARGLPARSADAHLLARADCVEEERDVWPERIPAVVLLRLAELRLRAGGDFEPDRALYLRAPDAAQPRAPKRVSA